MIRNRRHEQREKVGKVNSLLCVRLHLQQPLELFVCAILYGCVRHHPGHGGRIAAPQIDDAMLLVAVAQKPDRLSKVERFVLDLKVDFGTIQRCNYGFSYCASGRTCKQ